MKDFKVMLAKPLNEKKLVFPCYVSPKLDGIRAQYYKGEFYTRNQKKLIGLSHLKEALNNIGAGLDGELLIPGKTFQESSGLIRSYNEVPEVVYNVFDMPYVNESLESRLNLLKLVLSDIKSTKVSLVEHRLVSYHVDITEYYKTCRAKGYEGVMVKNINAPYVNKRSDYWMKIKEVETYDVLCVDFFEGLGRLTNTLGGIVVELDGIKVKVGGGFSDRDRDHIWANREAFRNTICEIAGQELTPGGSLRHPRFIGWRFDK